MPAPTEKPEVGVFSTLQGACTGFQLLSGSKSSIALNSSSTGAPMGLGSSPSAVQGVASHAGRDGCDAEGLDLRRTRARHDGAGRRPGIQTGPCRLDGASAIWP